MRDLPGKPLARRSLKALAVFITCITLSGCYACSLNGGWEGQMNPFCVEKDALVGPISLPKSVATHPLDAQPIRSSTPALGGAEGTASGSVSSVMEGSATRALSRAAESDVW